MAYFRGDNYIWSDGDNLHLWSRDGMDHWNNTGWCRGENDEFHPGFEDASGVALPHKVVDQFVMMRLAELLVDETSERIEQLIDDAVEVGNFGSDYLRKNAPALKEAFRALKLEKMEPR